jgi:hypothetical protein
MRAASAGHIEELNYKSGCELRCRKVSCVRAHQQPITAMQVEAGRIVTGSHDHTLKVIIISNIPRSVANMILQVPSPTLFFYL